VYGIVAITAVPALFFLVLELVLRVFGAGYTTDFFLPAKQEDRSVQVDNPRFGWQFFPRSLARQPYPFILPEKKSEGTLRVFILGGSAAMGDPDPAFSLARVLEVLLRDQFPKKRIEVINAAMTGINSHVVRTIARDCADHEPDYFVVYMGNNEVIGPYGPGTVFGSFSQTLPMIRLALWLKTTAIVQTMESLKAAGETSSDFKEWGGLRMFLQHPIRRDDDRLEAMYGHFASNARDIIAAANHAGARTVLCTVASNLRDCPPFASTHREDLSMEDSNRFDFLYAKANESANEANTSETLKAFKTTLSLDDSYADLHYRLGELYSTMGDTNSARKHFRLARETDALRFRADDRINEAIRNVAGEDTGNVDLVDTAALFEIDSPDGVPGDNLFVDHVHFNFHGTYLLARAVAERIAEDTGERDSPSMSEEQCAVRLAFTPWNELQVAKVMASRFRKPPFTNQLDCDNRMERMEDQIGVLRASATGDGLDKSIETCKAAIDESPDDWTLHENLARLLQHTPRAAEEAEQWRVVLRQLPHHRGRYATLGQALARAGNYQEAIEACRVALEDDPRNLNAYNGMGMALAGMGRADEAVEQYRKAIALRPDYTDARNNLALLLTERGRDEEAVRQYLDMLVVDPNDAPTHQNLAMLYISQEEYEKAIQHFSEAARLDPSDVLSRYHLGLLEASRNEVDRAVTHFEEVLRLDPEVTDAHINLGTLLAESGRPEEASLQFDAALKQRPGDANANYNMGVLFEKQGDVEAAEMYYERAVKADPNHVKAQYRLGLCYEGLKKLPQAITQYRIVLEQAPDWADVENELAWVLATRDESTEDEHREAVALAESACRRTDNENATFLDTLAAAYAAVGRYEDALNTAQKALQLARAGDDPTLPLDIEKRIRLFENSQPYREPANSADSQPASHEP